MKVVEYIGPVRELHKVPKKSHEVYDTRLGRMKEVACNWLKDDDRILSQPIDDTFAAILFRSPFYVGYDKNNKPEFKKIQSWSTGDAALKEEISRQAVALDSAKRENMALRQNLGKADLIKSEVSSNADLKEKEQDVLAPKKRGRPTK